MIETVSIYDGKTKTWKHYVKHDFTMSTTEYWKQVADNARKNELYLKE